MTWRSLAAGLLAGVGLLAFAAPAGAGDTVRLKLTPKDDTPTFNLKGSGDADVIDVAARGGFLGGGFHGGGFHGGGFHGGGFHGGGFHGGGFRGGFGHAGFRGYGYRGFGYGYRGFGYGYRGFGYGWRGYGYGYYWPFYGGYYSSYYYPSYYYPYYVDPYYYSPYDYYSVYPISGVSVATPSFSLRLGSTSALQSVPYPQALPPDAAPRTYPYDGGPAVPVPMPKDAPDQLNAPRPLPDAPADRSVSLPASGGSKFAYPAYGDKPQKTQFAADRVEKKNDPVVKKTP
jgi:hypothetical protein